MLEALTQIYSIANVIYNQIDLANVNKKQCKRLGSRVKLIVDTLHGLESRFDHPQYQSALFQLYETLKQCDELIGQFVHANWIKRVLKAGNDKTEFEKLNEHLNQDIQTLCLGINSKQLFDREQDKADQTDDQVAIVEMLTAMNLAINANHQELMAANLELKEIVVQKLESMHGKFDVPIGQGLQPYYPQSYQVLDPSDIYKQALESERAKNYHVAFGLYKQAADLGYKRAYTSVATFYYSGLGKVVPVDKGQAYSLFLKGAQVNHPRAQFNVAEMLQFGDGVPQDQREARYWYRAAARQQYEPAKTRCTEMHIDITRSRTPSPK